MPEGPEIRRAGDRIQKQLQGGAIEDAWFAFDELKPYASTLIGRHVERVETRGKAMLMFFSDHNVLYSHNQLYGVWKCHAADKEPSTRRSLRVRLEVDGRAASLYSASDISLWAQSELDSHPFLAKLGPDLLSQGVSDEVILNRLTEPMFQRRGLGGLLLDQGFLAGLGNYLRSEILFFAGLNPRHRPCDLSQDKQNQLAHCISSVTWQAYRQAGVTNTPEWIALAKACGEPRRQWRFSVFERDGLPCHCCAAPIEKVSIASRRLYFCPECQAISP
ncbi:endonuclease VIII [Halomonas sp. LS-001]